LPDNRLKQDFRFAGMFASMVDFRGHDLPRNARLI
jgi:hypothetical protein